LFAVLLSATPFHAALAQSVPDLGTAGSFAGLGGPAVTLTSSAVIGDVGVDLGGAVTLTTSTIVGTVHEGDTVAQQAYDDFLAAYDALALEQCNVDLTGQPLAGQSLTPGVYCFDAAVTKTGGVLTLDAQGDPNAVWIFKIGTLGTGALTGTSFSVVMANGGLPCNVYWWVAEAATMTDSAFQGTILAGAAITITGGTFNGDALAQAAVTMTGANPITQISGTTTLTVALLPVDLGSAGTFAVLAGSTVTNTGPTIINGDLGVWPGTAFVPGTPPGEVNGTIHAGDTAAQHAQASLTIAYNDAAGRTVGVVGVAGDLGGQTLAPGLYKSTSTLAITGDLTLDANSDPNAVFIFQIGSALTVATGGRVVLSGGAKAANVFWQVGSSATLGTYSALKGTVMAYASITIATGATLDGRALAQNAAVTLDTNAVTK
jgi:hypothetical protein